jgi:glycosidase
MRLLAAVLASLLAACGGVSTRPAETPPTRLPAASAAWWNGAVVYQVFVRSFQDSGSDGDGDFAGLAQKLDHLNDGNPDTQTDLGVDAIWLMPVYASPSYHGYDVTDYDAVEPDYGTEADFDALVAAAHARGIKVILDFVPNHSSSQHPWFLEAAASTAAAKRDWYVWSTTNPGWTQPWSGSGATWYPAGPHYFYGVFWSGMPDLNWKNAAVRAEISAVAGRWLARGVDGLRLDAVRYLVENGRGLQSDQPETHAALKELAASVRAANAEAMLVGEAWADAATIATYFGSMGTVPGGDELPLNFDFPLADGVVASLRSGTAAPAATALDDAARLYPPGAGDAPFLRNHDQDRAATELAGDARRLKAAAAILLTLQGTPFLYYGEEIGMANGCPGTEDECQRTPMQWDGGANAGFTNGTPWFPLGSGATTVNVAGQSGDPGSLLSRYRTLIRVRKASPALARGGITRLASSAPAVLAYLREHADETVLVAHNVGGGTITATLTTASPATPGAALFADPGAVAAAASGGFSVTLPPYGSGVWRVAGGP